MTQPNNNSYSSVSKLLLFSFLVFLLSTAFQYLNFSGFNTKIFPDLTYPHYCWDNKIENQKKCRPLCKQGSFGLTDMPDCHSWLTCDDIKDVEILKPLVSGTVKNIFLGKWKDYSVIVSKLSNEIYREDFHHNLKMLKSLAPSFYVTHLVGYCNDTIITQYHKLGDANHIHEYLESSEFDSFQKLPIKLGLCIDYIKAIAFLHNSPIGTRVMCDSNSLEKTLSQLLVTEELKLVINDLDALPEVTLHSGVKCGHRQLEGNFVAPEQLWPHSKPFNNTEMVSYNEKTDIWKIPDVCDYFLQGPDKDLVSFRLFSMNKKCKDVDPKKRPTALQLLSFYKTVWEDMFIKNV